MPLSAELKQILACPVCLTPVKSIGGDAALECTQCGRRYPVQDGFPLMFAEAAAPPPENFKRDDHR
jgi:uncharacterized protein YbaR (Trm112 family)